MSLAFDFAFKAEVVDRVRQLHKHPMMAMGDATGGGTGIGYILTNIPGSSETVLRFGIPWAMSESQSAMRGPVHQFVTREVACRLAAIAYLRSLRALWREDKLDRPPCGLGLTAKLRTDDERPDRQHRVIISYRTEERLAVLEVDFNPENPLNREQQSELCDLLGINMLLHAAGLDQIKLLGKYMISEVLKPVLPSDNDQRVIVNPRFIDTPVDDMAELNKQLDVEGGVVLINPDRTLGDLNILDPERHIIFFGSFRPLTPGHDFIARQAEAMTGKQVVYAISQRHPIKDGPTRNDLLERAMHFAFTASLVFVRDSGLYIDHAGLFKGHTLLLGVDAAQALLDPKFYERRDGVTTMLERFETLGTTFLVAGRTDNFGKYIQPSDLCVPSRFSNIFKPLQARIDMSSTMIRNARATRPH